MSLRETHHALDGIHVTLARLRQEDHTLLCCYERFTRAMMVCSRHLVQALVQDEAEQADLHLQGMIAVLEQGDLRPATTAVAAKQDAVHSGEEGRMALQQGVDLYLALDQRRMALERQVEAAAQFRDENAVCMARMAMQTSRGPVRQEGKRRDGAKSDDEPVQMMP